MGVLRHVYLVMVDHIGYIYIIKRNGYVTDVMIENIIEDLGIWINSLNYTKFII